MSVLVEVWSDVVCPWCYIGKRRLAAAIEQLDDDSRVRHADRDRLPAVPARPDRAARNGHACRRGLRPQVRRAGAGCGDDRPRHDRRRRGRLGVPPRPGAAGEHPRRPPAAVVRRTSATGRARRPTSRSASSAPTSSRAATSETPTCSPTSPASAGLDGDDVQPLPRQRRGHRRARPSRWRSPGRPASPLSRRT